MTSLLIYYRCKTIKKVLEKTICKFLITNRSKLLSKSERNRPLEEGYYKTSRNKDERGRKQLIANMH